MPHFELYLDGTYNIDRGSFDSVPGDGGLRVQGLGWSENTPLTAAFQSGLQHQQGYQDQLHKTVVSPVISPQWSDSNRDFFLL